MEFYESTQASWVAMVMERLQTVEKDNQELRDELRNRTPTPIDESKLPYTPSMVVSTYFWCPVYLDTTEFRSLIHFAESFMSSTGAKVLEAMFSWMHYDAVQDLDNCSLHRPIAYISAICWDIKPREAYRILSSIWKEVIVPCEILARDLYEETDEPERIIQMSSYITETLFYDVWSHLIGHARSAKHIYKGGCISRARDHLASIHENESADDCRMFMAQFVSACAMDRIVLHDPHSYERKRKLLKIIFPKSISVGGGVL